MEQPSPGIVPSARAGSERPGTDWRVVSVELEKSDCFAPPGLQRVSRLAERPGRAVVRDCGQQEAGAEAERVDGRSAAGRNPGARLPVKSVVIIVI